MPEELLVVTIRWLALVLLVGSVALLIARWKFPHNTPESAGTSRWREIWEAWRDRRDQEGERARDMRALRSKTALLIDPDEKSQRVLAWKLEGLGCKVITAKSGTQALKLANEPRLDLVISDALLPDISASDFYKTLGRSDIPIVFIGVLGDQWDALRHLGPNVACFAKPYDPEEPITQAGYMIRGSA